MNALNETTASAFADLVRQQAAELRNGTTPKPLNVDEALSDGEKLRDKVVVVTGAASGFGKAYALAAAKFGAKIVLSDLKKDAMMAVVDEITAAGGEATGIECDVTEWDAQVEMFRHGIDAFGRIDIVVANAGISDAKEQLLDLREGKDGAPTKPTLKTIDVNLVGLIYTTKLAFFHLNKNPSKDGKSIVLVASLAAFAGLPGSPVYCAAKHGVLGVMRSLYYDASIYGISINSIHPGFVKTPMLNATELLVIAGIPTSPIEDVVAAMVAASTKPEMSGSAFVVDFKGILELPHAQFERESYYDALVSRSIGLMSWAKWFSDIVGGLSVALKRRSLLASTQ
ncbi:hypothetical protein JCM6882_005246 [Rhodosporidiobolus microsporus]